MKKNLNYKKFTILKVQSFHFHKVFVFSNHINILKSQLFISFVDFLKKASHFSNIMFGTTWTFFMNPIIFELEMRTLDIGRIPFANQFTDMLKIFIIRFNVDANLFIINVLFESIHLHIQLYTRFLLYITTLGYI